MKLTLSMVAALLLSASCQTIIHPRAIDSPELASSQFASDFGVYHISRVGLMPVAGARITLEEMVSLQSICYSEFTEIAPFEIVLLRNSDLEEIQDSEPYLRGIYKPETIHEISKRYHLDGLLVATVTQRKSYPPQKLNMQVDLVAAETGMTIWSSAVALQADRPQVLKGIEAFYGNGQPMSDDRWTAALLSPSKFARFGVWQMARTL